jgi:transcriptional regulator with XRE-family HTH domain
MPRTATNSVASKAAGRAIRNARREVGLTQVALAKRLGTSAPYISELEAGGSNLTIGQLWAVADALRVELHIELRMPVNRRVPTIPAPPG